MRRYHTILIPALLLGGQGAAAGQAVLIDKVVAVVNDEVITLSEIHKEGKPLIQRIREELSEDTRARQMQITQRQILDALILRRLQLQEAKKEKVVVEQSEVTATIEQIKKERGLTTDAQFTEALARESLTLEELRTRVWEQLTVDRLITRKVRTSIVVSDEEVARYSETQADGGSQQSASMRIRHIFIGVPREPSPEDVAAARTRAAEASERLKRGDDFGGVAAEYSDGATAREGGDVGVIRQGDMDPVLERVAFALKPGSISEIIHTAGGFHIIKVEERMTGDAATAEAREQIRQRVFLQKLKQRMDAYLAELKQKAYIQVRLDQ
ncbi:MAG: peptidylprolyl isomerase [candidate division NC10 bacterium]|nr:peptidylprolyl isomerase [candidate division NC10 bacterium]